MNNPPLWRHAHPRVFIQDTMIESENIMLRIVKKKKSKYLAFKKNINEKPSPIINVMIIYLRYISGLYFIKYLLSFTYFY